MSDVFVLPQPQPFAIPASYGLPGVAGAPGLSNNAYSTRTAMAARLAPALLDYVCLTELGREGIFVADLSSNWTAAITADTQQGIFVLSTADATKVYRRVFSGPVNPEWFGLSTSGTAASNSAAISAMQSALRARATGITTSYQSIEPIRFPGNPYSLSSTIELTDGTFTIEGTDTGAPAGRGTQLIFPTGVTGIRVQRYNTSGASAIDGVPHRGGDGSIIRNLSLRGAFSTTEAEAHGINLRARAIIENVEIENFEGDGIYISASVGAAGGATPPQGNANNWQIKGAWVSNCRNGLWLNGSDVNSALCAEFQASGCRQWGVYDNAGTVNLYLAPLTQLCGTGFGDGTSGKPVCIVHNNGHHFAVIAGQETGASTNSPPTTATDNTWYYYYEDGGVVAPGCPAWFSGINVRAGGAYRAPVGLTAVNGYGEGGQPPCQLGGGSLRIGGTWSCRVVGGGFINANSNQIQINDLGIIAGGVTLPDDQTGILTLGRYSSGLHSAFIKCSTIASDIAIRSPSNTAGLSVADASITVTAPFGYGTGVGGTVTQATSRTTGVILNKVCGQITLFSAAGSTSWQKFTVTNSQVAATDVVRINQASGADDFQMFAKAHAGSFDVLFATTGGTTTEQPVFNFAVIKAVAA